MKNLVLLLLLSVALAGVLQSTTPAHAQFASDDLQPIHFLRNGDIYRYTVATGEVEQLTTWGYNQHPRMSPNGRYFAYNSIASQIINNNVQNQSIGDLPSNIWLWDLGELDDAYRIADQPANMVIPSAQNAGTGIIRGTPTWSNDSRYLAWLETQLPNYETHLVVYDVLLAQSNVIRSGLSLGFQDAGLRLPKIQFGPSGIAYSWYDAPQGGNSSFTRSIAVYDHLSGNVIYNVQLNADDVADFVWLDDMPDTLALFHTQEPVIETLNIRTGIRAEVSGARVGVYSRLNPNNLSAQITSTYSTSSFGYEWSGLTSSQQRFSFVSGNVSGMPVAISPSGDRWAYMDVNKTLVVIIGGLARAIPNTTANQQSPSDFGPIWGPTGFHLNNEVGTADVMTCNGASAPRLVVGGQASVIPGLGDNLLRSAPAQGAGSTQIASIPANSTMTVLAGPVCGSGFLWWLVNYNGVVGYTAESDRDSGTYWLQPN